MNDYITPDELAKKWKVSRRLVIELMKTGELGATRVGSLWRTTAEDVKKYEAKGSNQND